MNLWHTLSIKPTHDTKEVKRAYAKQLKQNRPEENPQGYQQLREAYSAALEYCKNRSDDITAQEGQADFDLADGERAGFRQADGDWADFGQADGDQRDSDVYDEPDAEPSLEIGAEFDEFTEKVCKIYDHPDTRRDINCWTELMDANLLWQPAYREALGEWMQEFLLEHYLLPKEVWELLDSCFYFSDTEDEELYALAKQNLSVAVRSGRLEIVQAILESTGESESVNCSDQTAMVYAAGHGYYDIVIELLRYHIDIEAKGIKGRTALLEAIWNNETEIATYLLEYGANGNAADDNGKTALMYAAELEDLTVAELLLERGVDLEAFDRSHRYTALTYAVVANNERSTALLLRHGASIEAKNGYSAFFFAVQAGNIAILELFRKNGSDMNPVDEEGITALKFAVRHSPDTVEYLLRHGADGTFLNISYASSFGLLDRVKYLVEVEKADVNEVEEEDGTTPLMKAAGNNKTEVVNYLIEQGALINVTDHKISSPLIAAAMNSNVEIMDILIAHGADLELRSKKKAMTVLAWCAAESVIDSMEYLLLHGADLEARGEWGFTPLMVAIARESIASIAYLVEKGAVINVSGVDHPVMLAIEIGRLDIVKLLIEHGADLTHRDGKGRTYLHYAAVKGSLPLVKYFLKIGLSLNDRGDDGNTVLLEAAENNRLDIVTYIITEEQGFDPSAKNNEGKTALDFAAEEKNSEMMALLKAYINKNDFAEPVTIPSPVHEFDEFMEKVHEIYAHPDKRKDIKCWNRLLDTDTVWKLKNGEALGFRMKDFLLECYLLPKEVWELIDSYFYLSDMDEVFDSFVKQSLYVAVRSGKMEAVKGLLENGADLEVASNSGQTAISCAAGRGYHEILLELLNYPVDLEAKDSDGRTALIHAIINDQPEIVKCLLEHGSNKNAADNNGRTALMRAIAVDDLTSAELLLEHGVDLEAVENQNGKTALWFAVSTKKEKNVALLLKHGANAAAKNKNGYTPVFSAMQSEHIGILELLWKNGADDPLLDLIPSSAVGFLNRVKYLVQVEKVDINQVNESDGATALMKAVKKNRTEVVRYLLEQGALVNVPDKKLSAPLIEAALKSNLELMELLIDHGADLELRTGRKGYTALFWCAIDSVIVSMDYLLEKGADIEARDIQGATPLMGAISRKKTASVAYLIGKGADVNALDQDGRSPVMYAMELNQLDMVQLLTDNGADINCIDSKYQGRS